MKILSQINEYLTDLGVIIAGIILPLLAVGLLLFPGLVFSIFLFRILSYFMVSQEFFSFNEILKLALLSIASWYVGVGVGKMTKDINEGET